MGPARFGRVRVSVWFLLSLTGYLAMIPLHFKSVEHVALEERYGPARGKNIGEALGIVSGWGYFLFLAGIWLSPQDAFMVPVLDMPLWDTPWVGRAMTLGNLVLALPFILPGAWLGVGGVRELTLRVSETHRPESVVTSGLYGHVRHPQYLGAVLSHLGCSLIFAALYALLATPLVVLTIVLMCRKEEQELEREFGEEYRIYRRRVPMLNPHLRRRAATTTAPPNGM